MDPGLRDRHKYRFDAENLSDPFRGKDLAGRASRHDAPVIEHDNVIGKTGRKVEIVHYSDRNDVGRVGKIAHLFMNAIWWWMSRNVSGSSRNR
jgi:hypothetical protein